MNLPELPNEYYAAIAKELDGTTALFPDQNNGCGLFLVDQDIANVPFVSLDRDGFSIMMPSFWSLDIASSGLAQGSDLFLQIQLNGGLVRFFDSQTGIERLVNLAGIRRLDIRSKWVVVADDGYLHQMSVPSLHELDRTRPNSERRSMGRYLINGQSLRITDFEQDLVEKNRRAYLAYFDQPTNSACLVDTLNTVVYPVEFIPES